MKTIVAIRRAERFSPNSADKDTAILQAVCERLAQKGLDVKVEEEDLLLHHPDRMAAVEADVYVTMGRHETTLRWLAERQQQGAVVVNGPEGIRMCCHRKALNQRLREAGICLPPASGADGYWLKRADGVAEGPEDVVFAADLSALEEQQARMRKRGIMEWEVSAHIKGDLIKFYGVRQSGFFFTCYPGDDGQWKFDDERRNGLPRHYAFDRDGMHRMAEQAAAVTGIDVYGGDCIVSQSGQCFLIDFNDWPSFSRCRQEAAQAIVRRLNDYI